MQNDKAVRNIHIIHTAQFMTLEISGNTTSISVTSFKCVVAVFFSLMRVPNALNGWSPRIALAFVTYIRVRWDLRREVSFNVVHSLFLLVSAERDTFDWQKGEQ